VPDTTSQTLRLNTALAGRYRIERELGQGGMATVYLAQDEKHDRKVAIKVLKPELAAVIGAERFLSEIKTTANLQHPHILPLHDSGQADSFLFYVMPFVAGESLRDRLNREKQLPIGDAMRIATEVASALDYAHRHGVIHRDIKPENILLHDGRALVADFGIALAATSAGSRMTETGMSLGTPHYMSPEQAMGDRELTPRSDVYALGAMTYEMLLGEPPFTGPTAQSIVAKVITERPASLLSRRDRIPPQVEDAVLTALEKLPADRFESARAFAEALANPAFTMRVSGERSVRTPSRGPLWRRVAVGMTAVAAGSLVFAASTTWKGRTIAAEPAVVRFTMSDDPEIRFVTHVSAPFGISPDGRTFVFSAADSAGKIALWVRTLDDPKPRRLQGTEDGTHPVISPDGEWVAYVAGNSLLSKVRIAGGSQAVLAELPGVSASLSWESNDAILCEIIAPSREIMRVSANGGAPAVAVPFDSAAGEVRQRRPLVLREAQAVLYVSTSTDSSSLMMYSLRSGQRARLMKGGYAPLAVIGDILVTSGAGALSAVQIDVAGMRTIGKRVQLSQRAASRQTGTVAAISETGTIIYEDPGAVATSRLELFDMSGKRTQLRDEDRFGALQYSPDGRKIAVSVNAATSRSADIWIIDVATREATRLTSTGSAHAPAWSSDGRRVMYRASANGHSELWSTPLDGTAGPSRLVEVDGDVISAVATPDGKYILVSRFAKGDARIELLRVPLDDPSRTETLVSPSGPNGVRPISARVSPDGRFVGFADRSRNSVHVRALDGKGEIQISSTGGCCPLWAPDSRRVFFRDAERLVAVDLETSPELGVVRRTVSPGFWGTDVIATTYEDVYYDLSPDGRTFVAVTPVRTDIKVLAAYNWGEEMRREWRAGSKK